MHGDGEIALGVAGNVPMRHTFVPRKPISAHTRHAVERRYRKREDQLAHDGYSKPKSDCRSQGGVGKALQRTRFLRCHGGWKSYLKFDAPIFLLISVTESSARQ